MVNEVSCTFRSKVSLKKKKGQRSPALKPLHVLEGLRQLLESVNMEVIAKSFVE